MHLPLTIKEIQAGYLTSSFFRDLYKYLAQNIMPHKRHTRHKVEALAESFILLDSLLFKLVMKPDKEKALLSIADNIIELYHSSLFAGHQGVVVYWRLLRHCALNCIRLHWLRIKVLSIVNEAKHKIIIILLSIFFIWCIFTIITTMTTNEKTI